MTSTRTTARSAIERLLSPRSVAIAGVSSTPGSLGGIVLDNLDAFGFAGDVMIVHPKASEIRGRRCFPSTGNLPFGIDCVVLAIPAAGVLAAVEGCAARGVGGIVIFSAGFAETGAAGKRLQEKIAAIAAAAGMIVEGPNCLGFINYVDNVPLTFSAAGPRPLHGRGAAVVSQSGAMATVVRAALQGRELDVTVALSTGNEAANGIEDFVEHLLDAAETRVVAMVVEHIRQPKQFLRLADVARDRGIALVMLHPGRSAAARHSAATHTGALVGDFGAMRTLVARRGVLLVDTLEELVDVTECLLRCAVRPVGGVAVLSESGAFKAMTLDYCESLGVSLPAPEGAAAAALDAIAPGLIVASNPLDLTAQTLIDPSLFDRATALLMADGRCGTLLVTSILSSAEMARRKMPPIVALLQDWAPQRPVLFAMLGEDAPVPPEIVAAVRAAGVPFFRSPERALRALARLSRWTEAPAAPPLGPSVPGERLPAGIMPEYAAKAVLREIGLPLPESRLASDAEGAVRAAQAIGFPVALKVQSKDLSHKSDVGGVILHLGDAPAVRAGFERMAQALRRLVPPPQVEGILVEHMAPAGLELIVGGRNDPDWGIVVAVGLGGVMAEIFQDVRLLSPDLEQSEILHALKSLKGGALFGPFRGAPARDLAAAAKAVQRVGRLMQAHPEITELDINPMLVLQEGGGVLVLDALLNCA